MELNKLVFPAPASSYTKEQLLGKLIYVPRNALKADAEETKTSLKFWSTSSLESPKKKHHDS